MSEATFCHMPRHVTAQEAALYRRLHGLLCERKAEPGHDCQGVVQISRTSLLMRCKICGDAKQTIPEGMPND